MIIIKKEIKSLLFFYYAFLSDIQIEKNESMKKALRCIFILIDIFVDLFVIFFRDYVIFHIACELLEKGVAAIFGPASRHTHGIVASIAARFDIPHIEYVWRENDRLEEENEKRKSESMTINVFPASEQVSKVSSYKKHFTAWKSIS